MGVAASTRFSPTRVVLVVEDDEDCRETIAETLQDAGYSVIQLADAEQALGYLLEGQTKPAGIVLDLWLPGMSGNELIAMLRNDSRFSRIPVVLTSAGRPCGAENTVDASWLPKPFDAENLLAAMSERCSAIDAKFVAGESSGRG